MSASARLFGGNEALRERIEHEARDTQGAAFVAWAPTSLAALACARCGIADGFARPLTRMLDALPLEALTAAAKHRATLARVGCRTLGDVRKLPRGGIGRRFDQALLMAMDQAYGIRPCAFEWVTAPQTFRARLELPGRVDHAGGLVFAAQRLLAQMCGWLAARNAGTRALRFAWHHDALRSKTAGDGDEITVRTSDFSRDGEHYTRLLSEHLAKITLAAPVIEIEMEALEVEAIEEHSASLIPDPVRAGEKLGLVLERIAARLGPERVLRPALVEDHRVEWMQHWVPSTGAKRRRPAAATRLVDIPQPTWQLQRPLRLAVVDHRPVYQGQLRLVAGPHRTESGWWDRRDIEDDAETGRQVQRDYWVAVSGHAGILYVYQERLAHNDTAWFLHGIFA